MYYQHSWILSLTISFEDFCLHFVAVVGPACLSAASFFPLSPSFFRRRRSSLLLVQYTLSIEKRERLGEKTEKERENFASLSIVYVLLCLWKVVRKNWVWHGMSDFQQKGVWIVRIKDSDTAFQIFSKLVFQTFSVYCEALISLASPSKWEIWNLWCSLSLVFVFSPFFEDHRHLMGTKCESNNPGEGGWVIYTKSEWAFFPLFQKFWASNHTIVMLLTLFLEYVGHICHCSEV